MSGTLELKQKGNLIDYTCKMVLRNVWEASNNLLDIYIAKELSFLSKKFLFSIYKFCSFSQKLLL